MCAEIEKVSNLLAAALQHTIPRMVTVLQPGIVEASGRYSFHAAMEVAAAYDDRVNSHRSAAAEALHDYQMRTDSLIAELRAARRLVIDLLASVQRGQTHDVRKLRRLNAIGSADRFDRGDWTRFKLLGHELALVKNQHSEVHADESDDSNQIEAPPPHKCTD